MTPVQLGILLAAAAALLAGGALSLVERTGRRISTGARWVLLIVGVGLCALVLAWHSIGVFRQTGAWQPLQDNLSAMLTLAVLLSGFVAYVQIKRPIALLEWFIMPAVIILILMAGHFGTTRPEPYLPSAYSLVHRISTYLGALAFVVAGATGMLYLLSDRTLRRRPSSGAKPLPSPGRFGSLERLEHMTYSTVTLGFALFSVGIVTGIAWVVHDGGNTRLGEHWLLSPKVLLAFGVWAIFGIVLHTPIAPRLRGRKNAILSLLGLVLTIATLFAVLLMPTTGGAG